MLAHPCARVGGRPACTFALVLRCGDERRRAHCVTRGVRVATAASLSCGPIAASHVSPPPRAASATVAAMQRRCLSSASSHPPRRSAVAASSPPLRSGDAEDDWSTIEVEVLMPESVLESADGGGDGADRAASAEHASSAPHDGGSATAASVEMVDAIDAYAKAKVGNFVRRLLQSPSQEESGGAGAAAVGLDVREVQGGGATTQFHARWRLPLPPEYGERFGEGFAPTAKEAEAVAAMHAERVIDALGFHLFQLSSKQRKHAEAARAAGRWAPMPATGTGAAPAEVVPSLETPSPPPLRMVRLSAQQQQARDLQIDSLRFIPVQRGGLTFLTCSVSSPHYLDHQSLRRVEDFLVAHRTALRSQLRFALLRGARTGATGAAQDLFLAQITLPLPSNFGKRVAMGKAPTRKEAAMVAAMHAELIIDAVGFALFPNRGDRQATHAAECAKVGRWCAQPGEFLHRPTAPSPPPMELVSELPREVAEAVTVTKSSSVHGRPTSRHSSSSSVAGAPAPAGSGEGRRGGDSSAVLPIEPMLVQHQRAIAAARHYTDELTLRDWDSAYVLLERYVEAFTGPPYSAASSPLASLSFLEELGQRDRRVFRATITVPLASPDAAGGPAGHVAAPLPFTQSFIAMGVAYVRRTAEVAAAVHALRTLAALNRLSLIGHHKAAAVQALESFASRVGLVLRDPALPCLDMECLPPGSAPLPVRVMEDFVGRVAGSGLNMRSRRHAHRNVSQEKLRDMFSSRVSLLSEGGGIQQQRLNREEDMLQSLRTSQERLPRLQWDTAPDADNRIIIAPDFDREQSRTYSHTLASVRAPDDQATTRLRDYLERYGKTLDQAVSVLRTSRDGGGDSDAHHGALYVATVSLPISVRQRPRSMRETSESAASQPSSPPVVMPEYEAQGEAPTRVDAVLLCCAHAEMLLDSVGHPLYDHPLLQRKHADTARALGRWAPLVRGAVLPPESLRHMPPPLRMVLPTSAVWARVQEQRRAEASKSAGDNAAAAAALHVSAQPPPRPSSSSSLDGGDAVAAAVDGDGADDETLCDISRLQFVHESNPNGNCVRRIALFFTNNGSDLYRVVRQYKVRDAKLGMVHRAVVVLPVAQSFGKRIAVGCAHTRRMALHLCCEHASLILSALHIPVFRESRRQQMYVRAAALKGAAVQQQSRATRGCHIPSPPGLYHFPTVAAAGEQPLQVPRLPSLQDRLNSFMWTTFVNHCQKYLTMAAEMRVTAAVAARDRPRLPRSHVTAEDVAFDLAESIPMEKSVRHRLAELCRAAGLPPLPEGMSSQSVAVSATERRYCIFKPLLGTPYTLRGVSGTSPGDCRRSALWHGVQLLLYFVRPNGVVAPTPRRPWWEGHQRAVCHHDRVRQQLTPHGCMWVLRLWAAMHSPPLRIHVRRCRVDVPAAPPPSPPPAAEEDATASGGAVWRVDVSIHELRNGAERVLHHATCDGVGEATSGNNSNDDDDEVASSAVAHTALRQLLGDVQRVPTMQSLSRYLLHQPQLHFPSLRVLPDTDEAVQLFESRVCGADALPSEEAPPPERSLAVIALLLGDARAQDSCGETVYATWAVEVLQRWVCTARCTSAKAAVVVAGETAGGDSAPWRLPSTMQATFAAYGFAGAAPTPLAGAVALLCRCLPPPTPSSPLPAAVPEEAERDRMLPLQLAHLLLMGQLLGCTSWAVMAAAMLACAEETLQWYDAVSARAVPYTSVDVTEVVLGSLDPAAAPLPDAVLRYAAEVERRLAELAAKVAAGVPAGTATPLPWLQSPEDWGVCLNKPAHRSVGRTPSAAAALSLLERRTLRPLLQCALATSAAPHALWVRAPYQEHGGGHDTAPLLEEDPGTEAHLVFQHRQAAHYAAVHVSSRDLTQADTIASAKDASAAATCFAAFGCVVYPAESLVSVLSSEEVAAQYTSYGSIGRGGAVTAQRGGGGTGVDVSAAGTPAAGDAAAATPAAAAASSATVKETAVPMCETDGEAEAAEGEEEEDDDDDHRHQLGDDDAHLHVRLFGTCISPLAAALVASSPTVSVTQTPRRHTEAAAAAAESQGGCSALQSTHEDLPMLLTAFQTTVPLLVHRRSSAQALSSLSRRLRSRVQLAVPFSLEERRAIAQLLTLPVHTIAEVSDVNDGA